MNTATRRSLCCLLIVVVFTGACARRHPGEPVVSGEAKRLRREVGPLDIWRDSKSTPDERRVAVMELVPQHSRLGRAIAVLGPPHYTIHLPRPVDVEDEYIEEDWLCYVFGEGDTVTLRFAVLGEGMRWTDERFIGVTLLDFTNKWQRVEQDTKPIP